MSNAKSYDYQHRSGVHPISWDDFHALCKGLAQAVAIYNPDIILAIGRGGYYPGTLIAHILQADIYPVRLSRRVNDVIVHKSPKWLVRPPKLVKDKRLLLVDEIASTGETLTVVKKTVEKMGAKTVRSAVLYAHSRGTEVPDYIGLISDALLLNPWDREIFKDDQFQLHPEYAKGLAEQGIQPNESLFIAAPTITIAKGG